MLYFLIKINKFGRISFQKSKQMNSLCDCKPVTSLIQCNFVFHYCRQLCENYLLAVGVQCHSSSKQTISNRVQARLHFWPPRRTIRQEAFLFCVGLFLFFTHSHAQLSNNSCYNHVRLIPIMNGLGYSQLNLPFFIAIFRVPAAGQAKSQSKIRGGCS